MPLRQHDAELVEQAAQRVGLHDAHLHELSTHAVQGQTSLLLLVLDRHGLDVRLQGRDPDGLGITGIGLVAQDKELEGLADFVAVDCQLLTEAIDVGGDFGVIDKFGLHPVLVEYGLADALLHRRGQIGLRRIAEVG